MKYLKIILTALISFVFCLSVILCGDNSLKISRYTIENEKISNPLRIVLVSDLHLIEYGKDNCVLLKMIEDEKPDIIAVTGDVTQRFKDDQSSAYKFLENVSKIQNTYFCIGNHEYTLEYQYGGVFDRIKKTGVRFLYNEADTVIIKGQSICIGGLSSFPEQCTQEFAFLENFEKNDCFKLLLCHYADYFGFILKDRPLDLILSGHAHGGQIRLPFIGGLFAPEQGLFPKYTKGVYKSDKSTVVVSAGLANTVKYPRLNNPTELVVIDIT